MLAHRLELVILRLELEWDDVPVERVIEDACDVELREASNLLAEHRMFVESVLVVPLRVDGERRKSSCLINPPSKGEREVAVLRQVLFVDQLGGVLKVREVARAGHCKVRELARGRWIPLGDLHVHERDRNPALRLCEERLSDHRGVRFVRVWNGVGGIAHDIGDAVVADIVVVLVVEEAVEKIWIRVLVRVRLSALDEEIRTVAEPKEGVLDRSWRVVQVDAILCEELRLAEFREDDVHLVCNRCEEDPQPRPDVRLELESGHVHAVHEEESFVCRNHCVRLVRVFRQVAVDVPDCGGLAVLLHQLCDLLVRAACPVVLLLAPVVELDEVVAAVQHSPLFKQLLILGREGGSRGTACSSVFFILFLAHAFVPVCQAALQHSFPPH
mmetsp:Transcript_44083/g.142155  ORF Transcript_44083/g.142155 Transcript_44083/m.142155 type:complete len:386 (-) Transcript_44083:745-1902(-)